MNLPAMSRMIRTTKPAATLAGLLALALLLPVALTACQPALPAARARTSTAASAASFPAAPPGTGSQPGAADPDCFTDDLGAPVDLPRQPQRVVALMGSYAETWLLAGGQLAGVTSDAVTERNLPLGPDVADLGSVKSPSLEHLLALSPDFVILSTDIEGHRKLDSHLQALGIPHAYFQVEHFTDYLDMLGIFTAITGRRDLYRKNGLDVQQRIQSVLAGMAVSGGANGSGGTNGSSGAGTAAGNPGRPPKVLLIRAFSGGAKARKADTMTGRMLAELGCDNIADRQATLLEALSLEAIIAEDPDFIFITTMGDSSDKALAALHDSVGRNPAWGSLTAVRSGRSVVLPKELFHYKPNARWDEAYAELARILAR